MERLLKCSKIGDCNTDSQWSDITCYFSVLRYKILLLMIYCFYFDIFEIVNYVWHDTDPRSSQTTGGMIWGWRCMCKMVKMAHRYLLTIPPPTHRLPGRRCFKNSWRFFHKICSQFNDNTMETLFWKISSVGNLHFEFFRTIFILCSVYFLNKSLFYWFYLLVIYIRIIIYYVTFYAHVNMWFYLMVL